MEHGSLSTLRPRYDCGVRAHIRRVDSRNPLVDRGLIVVLVTTWGLNGRAQAAEGDGEII
jgi:hypothetical protein